MTSVGSGQPRNQVSIRRTLLVATSALALGVAAAPAQAPGRCATAQVLFGTVMPDGSAHEPGKIRICYVQRYNPSSGLHSIWVDGAPVGLAKSRVRRTEGGSVSHPTMIFKVTDDGRLRLMAYAWPAGKTVRVFWLHDMREDLAGRGGMPSLPTPPG